ncbi:MAG: NAD-dependent deacylase [Myxococcota bacterium]|jgi:NAD-dependent deacetylase|nr:NAD-dependent deacylase [Myxococcota bacterium]
MTEVATLAGWLEDARHAVALTGAGVSTESGIPDFRSDAGLWKDADPMEVASIDGFLADPVRFYRFWRSKFAALATAPPSAAHRLLAGLEARGRMQNVVTQNIDGLHQRAGSHHVLEVHGSFRRLRCLDCGGVEGIESLFSRFSEKDLDTAPRCLRCGSTKLKPDVVLFGEALPASFREAENEARACDVMLVMGTSLNVYPVAGLVPLAKRHGAKLILLNREPTPFDEDADLVIHRELGTVSRELISMLGLG